MKTPKEDHLVSDIPGIKFEDIEMHCQKVHADAVVHGFVLLLTVPAKFIRETLKGREKVSSEAAPTMAFEGNPTT